MVLNAVEYGASTVAEGNVGDTRQMLAHGVCALAIAASNIAPAQSRTDAAARHDRTTAVSGYLRSTVLYGVERGATIRRERSPQEPSPQRSLVPALWVPHYLIRR